MYFELDPEDYPMTMEEALEFDKRLERGEIHMLYGSGPCTREEADAWVIAEMERRRAADEHKDE